MSWKTRIITATGTPLHVYNRGANRETIFFCESDYERFLQLLLDSLIGSDVRLLVYGLLPNHFHLILDQSRAYAVSGYMQKVCWEYSRYINKRKKRSGHLFEGRFKPRQIYDDNALLRLSHYIHENPVAAGLVSKPEAWKYSSTRSYTGEMDQAGLAVGPLLSLVDGPENYARFLADYDPSQPEAIAKYLRSTHGDSQHRRVPHSTRLGTQRQ